MKFDESEHPRDSDGKFTDGTGQSGEEKLEEAKRIYDTEEISPSEYYDSVNRQRSGHRDIPYGVTKEDFVSDELGVDKTKARQYIEALDAYSDNDYGAIRQYQRGESTADDKKCGEISERLEGYIKVAPKWDAGETYRGIGLSDEDLKKFTVGSVHDMKGTSSWSSEEEIARKFGDNYAKDLGNYVIFHSGTQRKGTSIRHLSPYPGEGGENEVLVSKDSKYTVLKRDIDKAGRIHLFLEEN